MNWRHFCMCLRWKRSKVKVKKYFYDLHVHSCLSPCGDDDMTPYNIAAMASIKGLDIVALTDHNSVKNCPAFCKAANEFGIIPIPGMELTTSEDIHLVCLFPTLESAMEFDSMVESRLIKVKNKPEVFGKQLIYNETDSVIGEESCLLINASSISVEEGFHICSKLGGVAYPAHIDRESNGVISILGLFPEYIGFTAYEMSSLDKADKLEKSNPCIQRLKRLVSSDAHYLYNINEAENSIEISSNYVTENEIREGLIEMIK